RTDASASSEMPQGFISLVPTQLARLLEQPQAIAWLRQFRVILVGGAPAWPDLLERSRQARLPLAPTYGMTETAAQVATLKPQAFLKGYAGVGRPLPHVILHLTPQAAEPIRLSTSALAVGYWPGTAIAPDSPSHPPFQWMTGDLGRLDEAGYLSILGRRDDTILSGGENVMPQEVEAAILATGWAADVCVVGLPDPEWGQRVAALWVPRTDNKIPSLEQWQGLLGDRLSRYKHPKTWRAVPRIPRNNRGKLNRTAIAQWFQAGSGDQAGQ
ncbi:MAG: AMP-binding protein, partial [Cyanobacteria bacterium P01_H01_bin.130]